MNKQPVFIGSEIYRRPAFGGLHPLSISRHGAVVDICRSLGWLTEDNYRESPQAAFETLCAFHDRDYVEALRAADAAGKVTEAQRLRYGFGTMENPLFPGLYERASTTVGGSILAAEIALAGGVAFSPGGGTHHGRPGRASGFCYFNDPVFAILTLLKGGCARVAYVDLDAHHGDGVEAAFAGDERVRTISVHEADKWPFSGRVGDRAGGFARNAPAPAGFNDSELAFLMERFVTPFLARFRPQAVVVTCGADSLKGDPLSGLCLSNVALQKAVLALTGQARGAVILGGGGYNPWTTVRCWAGLWGRIAGFAAPQSLPETAKAILSSFECDLVDEEDVEPFWLDRLDDPLNEGPVREEIREIAAALMKSEPSEQFDLVTER